MIKTLQLKNFRQHTDLALSFDQGVTVLRGANEAWLLYPPDAADGR